MDDSWRCPECSRQVPQEQHVENCAWVKVQLKRMTELGHVKMSKQEMYGEIIDP